MEEEIKRWLIEGDVSIQYQVFRDLESVERTDLRARIELEDGARNFSPDEKQMAIGAGSSISRNGLPLTTRF